MKKIVFISTHDFIAKRQGGFHVFAEKLSKDFEVIFFSYPRSFFIKIRKNKLIEYENINYFGVRDEKCGNVRNVSALFIIPPVTLLKYLPEAFAKFFFHFRIPSFRKFCDKYFGDVDFFILESNPSVILYDYLKKKYPYAKFLYRPSDPMLKSPDLMFYQKYEIELIKKCDFTFPVNQQGVDLYKKYIPDWDPNKYEIISNGIELSSYDKEYPMPEEYKGVNNIVSYIGARPAEWGLMIASAKALPDINFFVICPENPNSEFTEALSVCKNLHYIQGIPPQLVPQYVTNANVVMIPNPTDMYKQFPWGITAKYYQAMRAKKPIVVYSDDDAIKKLGIVVTQSYDEFISEIKKAVSECHEVNYQFDFSGKDWNVLAKRMKEIILSL